jgi:hypothetical protein
MAAWPHDSHEKLTVAGYTFIENAPCKSPKCLRLVKWYRTPKGHMMPFNEQFIPHFADCADARNFTSKGKKTAA